MPTTSELDEAVRLVLGVARLGEVDLAGWWGSHGLDNVGRYVLRRTFKRSWQTAALELDVISATRRHNDALGGRSTALHLFSDELPFRRWTASWLAEQKTCSEFSSLFGELESWDLNEARTSLARWADCGAAPEVIGDGLLLGELSLSEIEDEALLLGNSRLLAACYPLIDTPFRVPYFDLRR